MYSIDFAPPAMASIFCWHGSACLLRLLLLPKSSTGPWTTTVHHRHAATRNTCATMAAARGSHDDAPALDNLSQLSPEWLSAALSHAGVLRAEERVAAVHAEAFAVGVAMLSDLCRVTPEYEPASTAQREGVPSSLVVKFAASSEAKDITDSYGGYEQEIRFYREIAPRLDGQLKLGPCLYTAMAPAEQRYTLAFDDLATVADL